MAKFYCAYSGLECSVSHLSLSLTSREYAHPVFFMNPTKLLGIFSQYEKGKLTHEESYLLFLAYLNATDLVEFRVPAVFTKDTPRLVTSHMETLVSLAYKIQEIKNPSVQFPHVAISPETKGLSNVGAWLDIWSTRYEEFLSGNRIKARNETLDSLETKVQRLILDPNSRDETYALHLGNWAEVAASFPLFAVSTPFGQMRLSEYWKLIIRKCFNQKALFDIPSSDIQELLDHCIDTLELGTTYATSLINLLKDAKIKKSEYLGLGDLDLINGSISTYQIIDSSSTDTQDKNLISLLLGAPTTEPKRLDYPSEFEFQRAKIKYQASLRNSVSTSEKAQ